MHHPIKPPGYKPTEQEHRIAYLTSCLNLIYYDVCMGINMVRTGKTKDDLRKDIDGTPSMMERDLQWMDKIFEKWEEPGNGDKEVWEAQLDYDTFKRDQEGYLEEAHCGDCTSVAMTCMRCYSEGLYKIPYTATWGHHEGWKLLHEYNKLQKANSGTEGQSGGGTSS
jgi:hypothetical protein